MAFFSLWAYKTFIMSTPFSRGDAKRAAFLLAAASAVGGSVGPIAIGTGGLAGSALLAPEDRALATLPVTAFVVGSTIASIPAALLMRRIGRRNGFILGAIVGAAGALSGAMAVASGSFQAFCLAMVAMGLAAAFGQQYRFAAADAADPAFKPRAISWVLCGGIVTGVLGPQVSIHARPILPEAPFAGPFLVLAALFLCAGLVLSRLRVPPRRRSEPEPPGGRCGSSCSTAASWWPCRRPSRPIR